MVVSQLIMQHWEPNDWLINIHIIRAFPGFISTCVVCSGVTVSGRGLEGSVVPETGEDGYLQGQEDRGAQSNWSKEPFTCKIQASTGHHWMYTGQRWQTGITGIHSYLKSESIYVWPRGGSRTTDITLLSWWNHRITQRWTNASDIYSHSSSPPNNICFRQFYGWEARRGSTLKGTAELIDYHNDSDTAMWFIIHHNSINRNEEVFCYCRPMCTQPSTPVLSLRSCLLSLFKRVDVQFYSHLLISHFPSKTLARTRVTPTCA